jgi:hypothetical protein
MVFKSGHLGIDAHALGAHGHLLAGATKPEKYADFKRKFPRPWSYATSDQPCEQRPIGDSRMVSTNRGNRQGAPTALSLALRDTSSLPGGNYSTAPRQGSAGATLIGIDFAGPGDATTQRRKIIAIEAQQVESGRYQVRGDGFNRRLVDGRFPGWSAEELADALEGPHRADLVAMDFPFSIPAALLSAPEFARSVGCNIPFGSWRSFNSFVAERLPLSCPVDLSPFEGWRDKRYWLKRATDEPARAQPALKDRFQVLYNMTLLGNALLARLERAGLYRVVPFDVDDGTTSAVIEIYPGVTMRRLSRPDYKRDPAGAIDAVLALCRSRGIDVQVDEDVRATCETHGMNRSTPDPDASDALVALCTGILYREGHCERVLARHNDPRVDVEGVIWAPVV